MSGVVARAPENGDLEDPTLAIVRPTPESDAELAFEGALRPRTLAEFVGQGKVRSQLKLLLDAARMQGRTADHILLAGPPGLGKTIPRHDRGGGEWPPTPVLERPGNPARR